MTKNKDFLQSSSGIYSDNGKVFMFTNENVADYVGKMGDLTGKKVLSVASSGDHGFEAYFCGARIVDMFDINRRQSSVIEMKSKMIRSLSYNEFMDFFFGHKDPSSQFNPGIIKPICKDFSPQLNGLLSDFYAGGNIQYPYDPDIHMFVSYLSDEDSFNRLKNKLPQTVNFVHSDIMGLSAKVTDKYDLILLGNICESLYMSEPKPLNVYMDFYYDVLAPLAKKNLNPGGRICFDYMFGGLSVDSIAFYNYWNTVLEHLKYKLGVACPHTFHLYAVPSASQLCASDLVATMRKSR